MTRGRHRGVGVRLTLGAGPWRVASLMPVAAAASWIPARRATSVDVMVALHQK